jgi:hypothetical protein
MFLPLRCLLLAAGFGLVFAYAAAPVAADQSVKADRILVLKAKCQ